MKKPHRRLSRGLVGPLFLLGCLTSCATSGGAAGHSGPGGPGIPVAQAAAILRATANDVETFDTSPPDGFLSAAEAVPVGANITARIVAAVNAREQ